MIQERSQMGMRALALQEKWPNSRPPLGYRLDADNRLEVEPEEAKLVVRIFELYLEHRSMPHVAWLLDRLQVTTKDGGRWSARAVRDVLTNPLYTGDYSVADVHKRVPRYRIVPEEEFCKVTQVRFRFQRGRAERTRMQRTRKATVVSRMLEQYEAFLREGVTS
jgi:site-specific DNA recombinase